MVEPSMEAAGIEPRDAPKSASLFPRAWHFYVRDEHGGVEPRAATKPSGTETRRSGRAKRGRGVRR